MISITLLNSMLALPLATASLVASVDKELACGTGFREQTRGIAVHEPTGKLLCATASGALTAFSLEGGRQLWRVELGAPPGADSNQVVSLAFSADGSKVAAIGLYGMRALVDAVEGKKIRDLAPAADGRCQNYVRGARFSADGGAVAAISDGTPCVWSVASGAVTQTLERVHQNAIDLVTAPGGGKYYALSLLGVEILDAATGGLLAVREPYEVEASDDTFVHVFASAARVSPDGKWVALGVYQSTDTNGTHYGWQVIEIESRKLIAAQKTSGFVRDVGFSAGGKTLQLFTEGEEPRWQRVSLPSGALEAEALPDEALISEAFSAFVWFGMTPWPHPASFDLGAAATMDSAGRARLWRFH